jgi:glycosyltransferase involved in cell wall biosynthesis
MQFSIAIPAYKSMFLKECIESVLKQTFTNFELIIVNDCSPQPIDETVSQFNDSRITYYKNEENIGAENLVINWNNCLEKATGEFFIMMGDDDTMHPEYLEEFKKLIDKYPQLDVYHCRSVIIDERSSPISLTPSWPEFESVYDNILHRITTKRLQYISDFVYRTSVLKKNGGFYNLPLAWASDDISAYIACGDKGIAHTNRAVFNYRQNNQTISSTGNYYKKIEAIAKSENWFNDLMATPPANHYDKIIFEQLKSKIPEHIKAYKIALMSSSFKKDLIKNLIYFLRKRSLYKIGFTEIIKSLIKTLRF